MTALNQLYWNLGHLDPIAQADLNANDLEPRARPGVVRYYIDDFGFHAVQYVKNNSASDVVLGDVLVKETDVTFTAGVLASATKITTTGLTANQHNGKILIVEGNDTSAGDAPEGESGIIESNTATDILFSSQRPFSVASVADIDCRIMTPPTGGWHGTLGGANAVARDVLGGVIGVDGITTKYYGWVMLDGYHPQMKFTAAPVTALVACVTAASGQLVTEGVETTEKVVGYSPGTIESTHPGKMPFVWTLLRSRVHVAS